MVPTITRNKPEVRVPAVITFRPGNLLIAEQEADTSRAALTAKPHGVVLILRFHAGAKRSPLADDVDLLVVPNRFGSDPGFHRDGVALLEIERAVVTRVNYADVGLGRPELDALILGIEREKHLWPRSRLTGARLANDQPRHGRIDRVCKAVLIPLVEPPVRDGVVSQDFFSVREWLVGLRCFLGSVLRGQPSRDHELKDKQSR